MCVCSDIRCAKCSDIRRRRVDRSVLLVYTTSCGHITDGVGSVGYTNTHTEGDVMAMTGFYLCFHMKSVSVASRVNSKKMDAMDRVQSVTASVCAATTRPSSGR